MSTPKPRTISDLARRAESVLVPIVRAGDEPVFYDWLAERITAPGERKPNSRQMAQVLTHLRDQGGRWSWTPRMTSFVVDEATGEPGHAYVIPELADAAAVRAQTHQRVTSGVYASGDGGNEV